MQDPPKSPQTPLSRPLPELDYRWVHAGAQHLDLLPIPITAASTSYKSFSEDESFRIEERWQSYSDDDRRKAVNTWGAAEGEGAPKDKDVKGKRRASVTSVEGSRGDVPDQEVFNSGEEQKESPNQYKDFMARLQKDYEDLELIAGVPVSQDSLFEVSLPSLSLHPVYWTHTGPRVPVLRGTWFVTDETRPCSWELAEEIEKAYQIIQPWQPSYKDELATAVSIGASAEEKLKYTLPARFGQGLGIMFDDGEKGRLVTTGAMTYISRAFWSTLRAKPSGTYVYRGFAAACAASGKDKTEKRSESRSRRGSASSFVDEKRPGTPRKSLEQREGSTIADDVKERVKPKEQDTSALEEENAPLVAANEDDAPCTDLILVIHGIGQQLATQYEAYNFVYAGNQLRQVMRKQAANPALASIIRDRRCQVLPIQWRTSINLDSEKTDEDHQHSMDNRFTMADITINKSIPYVRELTNSVLLDIPLFMSHHRQKMIEAVCLQANRIWRLWIARNPDFEKAGRVHIIGHSLGSALAAHILSNQPTKMPHLSQLPKQVITKTRDRFLFNTSNVFLCGSPLGIFLHLDQAQLMPRRGRERTMHSPQDEALDRSGKFGCMALDSLYNCFYLTDPIAYQLNAAVDSRIAAKRPPLAITSVTAPFYAPVTDGFGTISRYLPTYLGGGGPEKKPVRPGAIRLPSGIEMRGPSGHERLEGSRGERRFSALNPHGNIDFYLPSAGVSEYLDMITAHAAYWTDPSFAAFLIAEIFSTRLDLMRTGMGLAQQIMPEGTIL